MTGKKILASKNGLVGKRVYGWVPDIPDQRDYLLSAVLKVPAKLPRQVDLRPLCSKVEDQGQLGSCTANALAGAIEFLERKDQVPYQDFSRLFIYYNESFESQEVARTGLVNLPKPQEQVLGGHAVLAVGYDDSNQRFIVRNSWGTDWGLQGYFTLPYKYLSNRNLSDDFWTIRRGELMVSRKI